MSELPGNHPREQLHRDHRFMQMQLVSLLRSDFCWQDRKDIADAMSINLRAYRSMRDEIDHHENALRARASTPNEKG